MELHRRNAAPKSGSNEDVLLIHDGKVFDVTDFLSKHPGGPEVLLEYKNRDVTAVMRGPEPHIHSEAAHSILRLLASSAVDDNRNGVVYENNADSHIRSRSNASDDSCATSDTDQQVGIVS